MENQSTDHCNKTLQSDLFSPSFWNQIYMQWEWMDVSVGHVPLQLRCSLRMEVCVFVYSVRSRGAFFNNNKFSTKTISHLIFRLIIHCARIQLMRTPIFWSRVSQCVVGHLHHLSVLHKHIDDVHDRV